ncbi:hypothetical protein TVAG_144710 [Trichomonas vaginalis G3]|uniref:Uncharacterized protein n=1 Tax=Trichomonas vaginalis (strain ATCC PRA-98 / G3) TaxID=412133 RepID=A2FVK5_TRIV3|nr:hypothetical protein TVAGG3_0745860 [Trichomonas vaginalis G3]EAX91049.1 hypothetical protein TVAG_144710 [Trichomonas vaginalis G3]KAI5512162.1 hypothetical protein TVAGG3_0745860 [Trichomonas vaginalis G3]|eukprot:XP_001303979.1 hypothetical protein [Trichomonas vaginalis G3]
MGAFCSLCGNDKNQEELIPLKPGQKAEHKLVFDRQHSKNLKDKNKAAESQFLDKSVKEIMDKLSSDDDNASDPLDPEDAKEYEAILKAIENQLSD